MYWIQCFAGNYICAIKQSLLIIEKRYNMDDSKTFVDLVLSKSTPLLERGYEFDPSPFDMVVDFKKHLILGSVDCMITVQKMRSNKNEFKVSLMRIRLKNYSLDEDVYENLFFNLPELMKAVYKIRIFSKEKQHFWQFDEISSLEKEVEGAIKLTLDYGIKWLEDPHTKPGWPGKPPRQK
jgi:hypothetical protein